MNDAVEDLKVLFPGRTVTVGGEEMVIAPFKFTQIPEVARMVAKFYKPTAGGTVIDVASMIEEASTDVWALMRLATGKDMEWLDTLSADDGATLLMAVIEENADFFTRRLTPMLEQLGDRLLAGRASAKH